MQTPVYKAPQQKKYARKKKELQELQKAVNKFAAEKAKHLIETDPRFKGLKYKPMGVAYPPSPEALKKAVMRLVDEMLSDRACEKTQKEIVEKVRPEFPELELHERLFSQKRGKWFIDKVQRRINDFMTESISVEGCKSLSDVRKRLKAKFLGKSRAITLKPIVTFTNKAVIVNNTPFTYYKKASNGKEYKCIKFTKVGKQHSINVKALAALLNRK